jgi:hypothetical protein
MDALDRIEEEDDGTVFRDVITLALAGFVAIVILLLPHIGAQAAKTAEDTTMPGNVLVEVTWPAERDIDIDLWVQAPGDIPVGYSNKGGAVFNLLRDDLGQKLDVSGLNYEVAYARGVVAGEYTVNLHLYRHLSGALPVPARVVVSTRTDDNGASRQILATDAELRREGQELTVLRFRLDAQGALLPDSVHNLQRPLRSGRKS